MWAGSGKEEAGFKVQVDGGLRGRGCGLREGRGRGNGVWAGSGEEEVGFKVEVSGI